MRESMQGTIPIGDPSLNKIQNGLIDIITPVLST